MTIKRIRSARRYTSKPYLRVEGELTADERRELEENHKRLRDAGSLESKLNAVISGARAQLTRSGLPHEPADPVYSPAWQNENKWGSLDWYAIEILRSVRWWSHCWKHDFLEEAAAELMRIGFLAGQAEILGEQSEEGRAGARQSRRLHEQKNEHKRIQAEARTIWANHSDWGERAVAKRIVAPIGEEAIRKIIRGLSPRRSK
jgi:hypothetical protein